MASLEDKVVIELLNVDNYDTWCIRIKLRLIHKKMWKVVEDHKFVEEPRNPARKPTCTTVQVEDCLDRAYSKRDFVAR
jgi:hypothetical protein